MSKTTYICGTVSRRRTTDTCDTLCHVEGQDSPVATHTHTSLVLSRFWNGKDSGFSPNGGKLTTIPYVIKKYPIKSAAKYMADSLKFGDVYYLDSSIMCFIQ